MNLRNNTLVGLAVAALLIPVGVSGTATPYQMTAEQVAKVNVQSSMFLEAVNCENSGGPQITLSGFSASRGNLGARVKLTNPSGKRSIESTQVAALMTLDINDLGSSFAKQPAFGGVGGNPYIYVQFSGDAGLSMLGRCVQSDLNFKGKGKSGSNGNGFYRSWFNSADIPVDFSASTFTSQCSPQVTEFNMNDVLAWGRPGSNDGGINATFVFSNRGDLSGKSVEESAGPGNHFSADETDVKVSVSVGIGRFLKNGRDGNIQGIGGNPYVEIFLSSDGRDTGSKGLGRCKDILRSN